MEEIEQRSGGTTFAEISEANFRPIPALVPPAELLAAFESLAGQWHAQIVHIEQESRALAALRDTLLPKLLSGEMRVAGR